MAARKRTPERTPKKRWQERFLEELAARGSITAACKAVACVIYRPFPSPPRPLPLLPGGTPTAEEGIAMSGEFVSVQIRGTIVPATVASLRRGYFLKLPIATRDGLSVGGVIDVNLRPHTIVALVAFPAGEPEVWAVAWPDLTSASPPPARRRSSRGW